MMLHDILFKTILDDEYGGIGIFFRQDILIKEFFFCFHYTL